MSTAATRPNSRPPALVPAEEVGPRVRRERMRLGLSQRDLAERSSLPLARLHRIETDPSRGLDFGDLARLAGALGVTLGRLTSSSPTQARVLAALRAEGDEADVIEAVDRVCDLIDLEEGLNSAAVDADQRAPLADVVGGLLADYHRDPSLCGAKMAEAVRTHMGLGDAPLGDLATVVENATGAMVAFLPLPESVSGLCATARDTGVATIAVNTVNTTAARQRFTLAHELGHLLAGDTHVDSKQSNSRPERLANAFAAHFLMPVAGVRDWVARALARGESAPETSNETVAMLMAAYGVSAGTAAIQLREAGLLSGRRVTEVRKLTARSAATLIGRGAEWASEEAGAATPRPPRRLWNRSVRAYADGRISLAPLARISGRTERDLEEEFARSGIAADRAPSRAPQRDQRADVSPHLDLDSLL